MIVAKEDALVPVADALPQTQSNRVDMHREGLEEWYMNGPLGVEQGFVLREAPTCPGPKTIRLAVDGDLMAKLDDPDGDGRELRDVAEALPSWRRSGRCCGVH